MGKSDKPSKLRVKKHKEMVLSCHYSNGARITRRAEATRMTSAIARKRVAVALPLAVQYNTKDETFVVDNDYVTDWDKCSCNGKVEIKFTER